MKRIGLDVGSTTIKCVVLDEQDNIVYSDYKRHLSRIAYMSKCLLDEISEKFPDEDMSIVISGSAGMGIANDMEIPFVQEVYATRTSVKKLIPGTDTVIELGGEDAKILFLSHGLEVRMNGSCAGGTGAFIDQMSTLMNITPDELNTLAKDHEKIYTIASRCGVFAKTDIQPLINQGARKEDIAASILYAVVNQTIGGLAQGREIEGNVLYLGGPLTFLSELRKSFDDVLKLTGTCPDNSLYYVALGAAMSRTEVVYNLKQMSDRISDYTSKSGYISCKPLFVSEEEYDTFVSRHSHDSDNIHETDTPADKMYLGIDAGSTTVKAVLCDEEGNIFFPSYQSNSGNPVPLIKSYLEELYKKFPDINIVSAAVTGYGEDIIRNAFHVDHGIVETIAHYTAAKKFKPDVDFIIDIGGQDIKCFKIHNGAIDNIFLNEACSSGCGSFLQTFAGALGYSMSDFAALAKTADKPVDLGSRCTVFMNSSVKQAQKDGASINNISAGLSISVVKNALYKVIRCASAESLGKNIVVQGGTFLNDSVLRAFEQEIGHDVIRPHISGLMGAYGAALYAMEKCGKTGHSTIATAKDLEVFTHDVKVISCNGCNNHCRLTINTFDNGRKFIAGNRCEKPLNLPNKSRHYDLYDYKYSLLKRYGTGNTSAYGSNDTDTRPTIGIPLVLNMYELLPFWYTLFDNLGFRVIVSPESNRKLYLDGQHTIPSDTVCFPAKLVHGHIEALLRENVDAIFYPCMSYNVDENLGDNHYNCPVVAYYPVVIDANVKSLKDTVFIKEFISIHNQKEFSKHFRKLMSNYGYNFQASVIKKAALAAYDEYNKHMKSIREKAGEFLDIARKENLPVIVLAGRPYHVDPEVNHSINKMICNLGAVVLTEDSLSWRETRFPTRVLNQWTYHSRMYAAAKFIAKDREPGVNMNLVQLVSFGCGVDAVTTDEARSIIERSGKIYTQIKIDEVSNMGAIKIRLRSLFSAAGL